MNALAPAGRLAGWLGAGRHMLNVAEVEAGLRARYGSGTAEVAVRYMENTTLAEQVCLPA